jgi:hypothetical protein
MPIHQSQKLWNAWGRQLQQEFVDICYQHSIGLIPPVIEITEATRTYGSWRAETRTLCISCHLICQYSWDVTINVLKHEMAHQICSEIFQNDGPPHDRDFIRACDLLGLPPEYCRAGIDFSSILADNSSESQEKTSRKKTLEKIKKLLAMTGSNNEHEALAALQMAGRIMEKYGLDGSAEPESEKVSYRIINTNRKRIEGYQRHIVSILSRYFNVKLICSRLYDPSANEVHKTYEIFGLNENVEIAEHCFHFLENRLAYLWQHNRKGFAGSGRNARKSYYLGILHGFSEKLQVKEHHEIRPGKTGGTCRTPALAAHPLSVDNDQMVQECIRRRYPRLRTLKSSRQNVSPLVYNEGKAAGKEIILSKVLRQQEDQEKTRLLT